MIYEFALDPEVISDWNLFRLFYDKFGIPQGRLIAQFPKRWKKLVYEAVERNEKSEINKKRIVERLNSADSRLWRKERQYNPEVSWLLNAVEQHELLPFHAIISNENQSNSDRILLAEEVDENTELWNIPVMKFGSRKAIHLTQFASALLSLSKEVIFVDPHFKPDVRRFQVTLELFLESALTSGQHIKLIEYHVKRDEKDDYWNDFQTFKRVCENELPKHLPKGIKIKFIRWEERREGKKFHARYLLTDKGGLLIETGLDEGKTAEETPIILLNHEMYGIVRKDFNSLQDMSISSYKYENEFIIIGNKI